LSTVPVAKETTTAAHDSCLRHVFRCCRLQTNAGPSSRLGPERAHPVRLRKARDRLVTTLRVAAWPPLCRPSAGPAKLSRHTHQRNQCSRHRACTATAQGPTTPPAGGFEPTLPRRCNLHVRGARCCNHYSKGAWRREERGPALERGRGGQRAAWLDQGGGW